MHTTQRKPVKNGQGSKSIPKKPTHQSKRSITTKKRASVKKSHSTNILARSHSSPFTEASSDHSSNSVMSANFRRRIHTAISKASYVIGHQKLDDSQNHSTLPLLSQTAKIPITQTQCRSFALKAPQRPKQDPALTRATPVSFEVSNTHLFFPPQTMEDINQRRTEFSKHNHTDSEIKMMAELPYSPCVPHPTLKGKFLTPRYYELNPDEVSPSLMTPFSSGKFSPNDFGQNPISQAVLNGNVDNLRQLLMVEVHDHCNALARRIKNDPRVNHPLKDVIYADDSTPENPSFAVRYLISARDFDGIDPLFYSLAQGNLQLPQLLLASGAYLGYEYIVPEAEVGTGQKSAYENSLNGLDSTSSSASSSIHQKQHQHNKMVKTEYQNETDSLIKPDPVLNQGVPQDGDPTDPNLGSLPFKHQAGNPFLNPIRKTLAQSTNNPGAADPITITPLYHTHTLLTIAASIGDPSLTAMLLYAGANPNQILSSYQEQRLAGYTDYLLHVTDIYKGQKRLFDVANQIEMEKPAIDRDLELLDAIGTFYQTQDFYRNNLQIAQSYLAKLTRFGKLPKQKFNFDPLVKKQEDMLRHADRTQQKAFFYHQTALASAVLNGNSEMAEILVAHGADIQFANYLHGQSLLEIAVYTDNTAILTHLLDGLISLRDPKYSDTLQNLAFQQNQKVDEYTKGLKENEVKSLEGSSVCASTDDLIKFATDQASAALRHEDPVAVENMKQGLLGDLAVYTADNRHIYVDHARNSLLSNHFPKQLNLKTHRDLTRVGVFANDYTNLLPSDFQDPATKTLYLDPWKEFTPKFNNIARIEPYKWSIIENLQHKIEEELWNDHLKTLRSEGLDPLKSTSNDLFQMASDLIPPGFRRSKLSKLEYLTLRGTSVFEQLVDVLETNRYQAKINTTVTPAKAQGAKVSGLVKPLVNPSLNPDKQDSAQNADNYNKLINFDPNFVTSQFNPAIHKPRTNPLFIHQMPSPPLTTTGRKQTPFDKVITDLLSSVLTSAEPKTNPQAHLNQTHSVIKPSLNDSRILVNNNIYTAVSGYPAMFEYHFSRFHVDLAQREAAEIARTDPGKAQMFKSQIEGSEANKVMNEYKRVINTRMDEWHQDYFNYVNHIYPIYNKHAENVAEVRKIAQLYTINRKSNWMKGLDAQGKEVPGWEAMKKKFGLVLGQNEFHYQQFLETISPDDPGRQFKIDKYLDDQRSAHLNTVQHFIGQYLRHKRRFGPNKPFNYDFDLNAESPGEALRAPIDTFNWDESFDPTQGFDPSRPDAPLSRLDVSPITDPYWLLTPFDGGDQDLDLDVLGDLSVDDGVYMTGLLKSDPTIHKSTVQKLLQARRQQRIYAGQIQSLVADETLTSILLQFDPALGVDQMEPLLKLDPFWNHTQLAPAMAYFYYIRRRSHLPPDISTFINFNRLKDIAQHFGKMQSLMVLAHYRGGVAVPPNQDQILIDVDEHSKFGDFNRNRLIEKLDGRYFLDMEMPSGNDLGQDRRAAVDTKLSQLNNANELKLTEMVRQHTLQDRKTRAEDERKQLEKDAKVPTAINHNFGAKPQDLLLKNHQVEKETISADSLHHMYKIVNWISRTHHDGSLARIFIQLGLYVGEPHPLPQPKPDSKPFEIAPETIDFISNVLLPTLRNQSKSVKHYEQQIKDHAGDEEALALIPVVAKLAFPDEIFELIPFFEQIHDAASNLAGSESLAYALQPHEVDNMKLNPETKKFVKTELAKNAQLQHDHDIIMQNLSGVNIPELQIDQASQTAYKKIQKDQDRSRLSSGDIQFYSTRGGVAKPYPLSYTKSPPDEDLPGRIVFK